MGTNQKLHFSDMNDFNTKVNSNAKIDHDIIIGSDTERGIDAKIYYVLCSNGTFIYENT